MNLSILTFDVEKLTIKLMPMHKSAGFTLIELLVAITIIAILSVVGITVYTSTTNNAKDTKRKQDIDAIANAYEQHYDPATSKYQPIPTDPSKLSEWFQSGVPKSPTGEDYENLLTYESKGFNVCGTLSNRSKYCKASIYGTLADIQSSTSLCADGTNDKVYSSNMVGCNGSATSGSSNDLCAAGAHVCSVSEYSVRGGNTADNPNDAVRFLSDTLSGADFCENTHWVLHPGIGYSIATHSKRSNYDSDTCGISNQGWYAGNGGGGAQAGVVCCN